MRNSNGKSWWSFLCHRRHCSALYCQGQFSSTTTPLVRQRSCAEFASPATCARHLPWLGYLPIAFTNWNNWFGSFQRCNGAWLGRSRRSQDALWSCSCHRCHCLCVRPPPPRPTPQTRLTLRCPWPWTPQPSDPPPLPDMTWSGIICHLIWSERALGPLRRRSVPVFRLGLSGPKVRQTLRCKCKKKSIVLCLGFRNGSLWTMQFKEKLQLQMQFGISQVAEHCSTSKRSVGCCYLVGPTWQLVQGESIKLLVIVYTSDSDAPFWWSKLRTKGAGPEREEFVMIDADDPCRTSDRRCEQFPSWLTWPGNGLFADSKSRSHSSLSVEQQKVRI